MNRYLLFLFCLVCCMACRSDTADTGQTDAGPGELRDGPEMSITGHWVNEEYYAILKHHKSLRRAQKSCEMCLVSIPGSPNQPVEIFLNFHEVLQNVIIRQVHGQFQVWEVNGKKPVRMIDSIQMLPNGKIRIGNQKFIDVGSGPSSDGFKIAEQILFNGAYINEEGDAIVFTKDGKISGLGDYRYYKPVVDYLDAGRDVDQIKLGKTKTDMELFAFKFKKKKLQLYTLECKTKDADGNCEKVDFGDLVFNLKKAK